MDISELEGIVKGIIQVDRGTPVTFKLRTPHEIIMPPRSYDPNGDELRREYTMPGATLGQIRSAFSGR